MKDSIQKGTAGILATAGGLTISVSQVNAWLQCVSLCVGIAVGVASFVSILRKKQTKKNKTNEQ